jgi:hypothetical protein
VSRLCRGAPNVAALSPNTICSPPLVPPSRITWRSLSQTPCLPGRHQGHQGEVELSRDGDVNRIRPLTQSWPASWAAVSARPSSTGTRRAAAKFGVRLAGVEPATLGLEDEGRPQAGPPSFCVVPHNRAPLLEFSLLASGTEQDSRRTRGPKSACLTGAFSANQRKPSNRYGLLIVGQAQGAKLRARRAGPWSPRPRCRCLCAIAGAVGAQ